MENLDEVDLKLLKILHENSNFTVKELAKQVNLSASYIAILDAEKLHQGFIVFCNIKLKKHDRNIGNQFVADIMDIDEIVECYNISGDFDFLLKVYARNMKHYQDFVFNKLGGVKSIGSTHSTFVMTEIKNTYGIGII